MKKGKKWLAILLAGVMAISHVEVYAEELISSEDIILENDNSFSGQYETSLGEEAKQSLEPEVLESLSSNEAFKPLDSSELTSFEKEDDNVFTDSLFERAYSKKTDHAINDCIKSSIPEVGISSNTTSAFNTIVSYITTYGEYRSEYDQFYVLIEDDYYELTWYIYYNSDYNYLDFYSWREFTDKTTQRLNMVVPYGLSGEVIIEIEEFEDREAEDPYDTLSCNIPDMATYKGTESFTFYVDNTRVADDQATANTTLKIAFQGWERLVRMCGETLQNLGFLNYGKANQTAIDSPSITGFYNSVKGADIRWNKVANATSYKIYRKRSAEGTKLAGTVDGNTTQFYDTFVQNNCWGRVYVYYVVAVNGSNTSAKSNEITLQRLAPMKITGYRLPSEGAIDLKWACC